MIRLFAHRPQCGAEAVADKFVAFVWEALLSVTIKTMNRRLFLLNAMQAGLGSTVLSQSPVYAYAAQESEKGGAQKHPNRKIAVPTADQIAWQNLELGMFVHLAPNTWQDVESDNLSTPLAEINPRQLNTDQWAQTAVDLGARYIVFVAKHQGGFCMWQTNTTDYNIRNTPWKNGRGDVLADVAASCEKFGLKLGVYVCPRDDHFGATTGGICKTKELQAKYDKMYREQLTEVLSRYGSFVEVWFDGSTVTPVGDLLTRYHPHAAVFQGPQATIRWVGNEDGFAPYPCWNGIDKADARTGTATALNSDADGEEWLPCEVDVSMRRPDWFWNTKNEDRVLTQEQLLSIYYRSVGRGTQLLINIPGERTGLLPGSDCAVAKSFGDEVRRRFSNPIASTSGFGKVLTLKLSRPTEINTVLLQEDTAKGERIREYGLEGRVGSTWQPLGTGTAIGHKRIQPVTSVSVSAVRLVVTGKTDVPFIRTLAVFNTGVKPPSDWNAPSELWSADLAGSWNDHTFSLDLTSKITAAAQYRLRFVPKDGRITGIKEVIFKLRGVAQPSLVKSRRGKTDEIILDITEIGGSALVAGKIEGAVNGQILLKKL